MHDRKRQLRAAIYARTSTARDQDPALQVSELGGVVEHRGWELVGTYVDRGVSGAKGRRPELDRLLDDAKRGRIDVVLVWRLDRLGRSLKHLLTLLEELRVLNVDFLSLRDPVDSTTPAGRLSLSIIGAMAEFERELIRERTVAGLEAARRRGARIGRPRVVVDVNEAIRLRAEGLTMSAVAHRCGCGVSTLRRELAKHRGGERGLPAA
ncbi:MAG: recombinase family protein [Myxococcales bacterium]|nr:recombinase family protein [Myxococcales bacterium]